jgi:hypothetical protein
MKKVPLIVFMVFTLGVGLPSLALGNSEKDIQAIKKAVKENSNYKRGEEAKWLKVLITDDETNKVRVKVTLPLALVELCFKAVEDKELQIKSDDCDIDLKELFIELKKHGPMALIEVNEDGETIKIWLE